MAGEARSHDPVKVTEQTEHMVQAIAAEAAAAGVDVEIDVHEAFRGYRHEADSPLLAIGTEAAALAGLQARRVDGGGGSDANVFNAAGTAGAHPGRRLRERALAAGAHEPGAPRRARRDGRGRRARRGDGRVAAAGRRVTGRGGRGTPAPPSDPLVAEFLDYVRYERGLSPNTVTAYGRDLAAFSAFLSSSGTAPGEATPPTCAPTSPAPAATARRRAWRGARPRCASFYAYLVREGVREDDPAALLRTPKRPQELPRVLSVEEVEEILAAVVPAGPLGQRDLAALELLYGCGLRVSELLGLRDGDVDVEGGLVRCVGKGDKERVVPMGGAAAAAVSRYVADGRRALLRGRRRPELILNARGGPLTRQGFDYILRRVLARADMLGAASAHTFRHSFATHLLAAGADLRSVQEMLGHANVATTQLYTHVTVEHLREVFLETHPRARRRRGGRRTDARRATKHGALVSGPGPKGVAADGLMTRVFVCVLDGCGAGALPDAAAYGDEGSDTLRHVLERADVPLPNLCGGSASARSSGCRSARRAARRPTAAWPSAAPARTRPPATGR